jgi:hypothetical protein
MEVMADGNCGTDGNVLLNGNCPWQDLAAGAAMDFECK